MMEQSEIMGMRIKSRRKERKIKQTELAEYVGISPNHMSGIETGKQTPSFEVFQSICRQLDTTPDYLLLGCMRPNNVPSNIIDSLRLCTDEQLNTVQVLIESYIKSNR